MTQTTDQPHKSIKKAVIAIALAVALLAGGSATFANWFENQQIGSSSITAGHLTLTTPATPLWTVQHTTDGSTTNYGAATTITDITAFRVVPGDKLTYTATVDAKLMGNNLKANLIADTTGLTSGTTDLKTYLTTGDPRIAMKYNTAALTNPLTTDGTGTEKAYSAINVEVILEFPFNGTTPTGTEGENLTLDLSKIKLLLNQIW